MQQRKLPSNIKAEQNLLSSMIMTDNARFGGLENLKAQDFERELHQMIFDAIKLLVAKKEHVSVRTVCQELKKKRAEENSDIAEYMEQDDETYIKTIIDDNDSVNGYVYATYAKYILDCSLRRKIIYACETISDLAYDMNTEHIYDRFLQIALETEQIKTKDFIPISDIIGIVQDKIEKRKSGVLPGLRISSKLPALNWLLEGISRDTEFVLIGARPSNGKTVLLNEIAISAIEDGERVLYFTLETSKEKLTERILTRLSGISKKTFNDSDDNIKQVLDTSAAIYNYGDLLLFDDSRLSIHQIINKATRAVLKYANTKNPVAVILVDYLQIIGTANKKSSRNEQVGEIASGLKGLSQTLKIPVVAASQLSRDAVGKPQLSHLREGGNQEAEADKVILIDNPPSDNKEELQDESIKRFCTIEIAKNKDGRTAKIECEFQGSVYEFTQL